MEKTDIFKVCLGLIFFIVGNSVLCDLVSPYCIYVSLALVFIGLLKWAKDYEEIESEYDV